MIFIKSRNTLYSISNINDINSRAHRVILRNIQRIF